MIDSKSFFKISAQRYINNTGSILANSCTTVTLPTIFLCLALIGVLFPCPCILAQEETALLLTKEEKGGGRDIESVLSFEGIQHLNESVSLIRYYDEVLTQSVRNYVFTRDKKWLKRYKETSPKLDKVFEKAITQKDLGNKDLLESIARVNRKLLKMEARSIQLVDKGQVQQALDILESAQYLEQKEIYSQNLNDYAKKISEKLLVTVPDYPMIQYTDEEKAWLQMHPVLRVVVDPDYMPYENLDKEGMYRGIGADYTRLVAERLGVAFEVIPTQTWKASLELVQNREADLLPFISTTPERLKFLNFTDPYNNSPMVIIVRRDFVDVQDIEYLTGKRVALVQAFGSYTQVPKLYPGIIVVPVESTAKALRAVATGNADATVSDLAVSNYIIHRDGLINLRVARDAKKLDVDTMGYGVRKDWPEFIPILNKALATITPEESQSIRRKWNASLKTQPIALTEEERAWIKDHPVIRVSSALDYAPFNFRQAGEPVGYSIDYMKLLAGRLGI